MKASRAIGLFGTAICILLLVNCKNTQRVTGNGAVKVLGYSNDDAPVDAVSVMAMGGGAPAVIPAQQMDVQTESPAPKANKKNIELARNERITFDSSFVFERNSDQLTASMEESLSHIIRIAKKHENTTIFIEGYTEDAAKESGDNLNLSEKRAKAIADYLVNRKIKSNRIKPREYDDTQPLFSNKSAQGRIRNRKVEVSIIARANDEQSMFKK